MSAASNPSLSPLCPAALAGHEGGELPAERSADLAENLSTGVSVGMGASLTTQTTLTAVAEPNAAPTTSGGFAIPAGAAEAAEAFEAAKDLTRTDGKLRAEGDTASVVVGEELAERLSVESLLRNFAALLEDVDYRDAFEIIEIGALQFGRRKRIRRELQALYIGLWRLALKRSFPSDYAAVFHAYMEQQYDVQKQRPNAAVNTELVLQYVDKLREHGDNDFSAVSRHVLSLLEFDDSQTRALTLKIALHLRRVYKYFFDHLL